METNKNVSGGKLQHCSCYLVAHDDSFSFQQHPDESIDYYFGDTYRKYMNNSSSASCSSSSSSSTSSKSSNPGSPNSGNTANMFGSLFVSADSPTPYTDATQVS